MNLLYFLIYGKSILGAIKYRLLQKKKETITLQDEIQMDKIINPKKLALEWILKHTKKQQDKVQVEYTHENLERLKLQGYKIINKTENYILLTNGLITNYIVYDKRTHEVQKK